MTATAPQSFASARDDAGPPAMRLDATLLPSPGRVRYLLLIVVVLLAGSFAGMMTHDLLLGRSRAAAWVRCFAEGRQAVPGDGLQAIARSVWVRDCVAPVEHRRALSESGSSCRWE
jgi:hypothetical protein